MNMLSPSTRNVDLDQKLREYRQIPSLQDYLLIEIDQPHITRYRRQADGTWNLSDASGLDATLTIDSLSISLPLSAVYARVTFFDEDEATAE